MSYYEPEDIEMSQETSSCDEYHVQEGIDWDEEQEALRWGEVEDMWDEWKLQEAIEWARLEAFERALQVAKEALAEALAEQAR